jgi:hypothetical protein
MEDREGEVPHEGHQPRQNGATHTEPESAEGEKGTSPSGEAVAGDGRDELGDTRTAQLANLAEQADLR